MEKAQKHSGRSVGRIPKRHRPLKLFLVPLMLLSVDTSCSFVSRPPSKPWTGRVGLLKTKQQGSPAQRTSSLLTLSSSSSGMETTQQKDLSLDKSVVGTAVILVPNNNDLPSPFGSKSPVDNPSWVQAARHLALKTWFFSNATLGCKVIQVPCQEENESGVVKQLLQADALVAMGMGEEHDLNFTRKIFHQRLKQQQQDDSTKCQFALNCQTNRVDLISMVGPYNTKSPSIQSTVVPWSNAAIGLRLHDYMMNLFARWTSDDFCVALLLYFNQFVSEMDWVKYSVDATWEKGPQQNLQELSEMVTRCGDCIVNCLQDESCRTCLNALTQVDTRDQVASYRTIVSYESELLKDFSFCILQKNNIFHCDSQIPTIPKVEPLVRWRSKALTTAMAQEIIIGHLDDKDAPKGSLGLDVSWKVAAGANVAYDQFPSQHQLFYKDTNGRNMWYDPVFRVETIDGRSVWCKRHYRVRDGPVPGTFRLSVLDNGVTSNEFWTLVGVADDLSWIVFHYAGAASAVGQQYLGGLLCTPDGELPPVKQRDKIYDLFRSAGIEPWDLFVVDNNMDSPRVIETGPPPLDFFYKSKTRGG